ncbi:unnamed protein product [Pneumocystis jirovecii]|uniref:ER-derived vesicles protein ERV14 n=2 Tax=Pneumocystis jirovecii TaxID=42068 RepID=L0P8W8_PNEJI|nr:uncharacterized protein T551_03120 [Pneumocystis jirovecii RU7]KTW27126.1 hypothetical protein T551_03120 [Pneumocystis jirovecii RU7]CCJ28529.1 unnamed protein product [Pneumocystis jirovecii]
MLGSAWLYLLTIIINSINLFMQIFFTIMYSDLECDYINPIDLCNKLNMYILPEAIIHGFTTLLFLLARHWLPLILNFPMLAYNINKIVTNQYALDATEIFRTLSQHKKESFIKLANILFYYNTYRRMISTLIQNNS